MPKPKPKSHRKKAPKRVLALPDLEQAKTAVLNSLTSASGQRTYDHAILIPRPAASLRRVAERHCRPSENINLVEFA